MPGSGIEQKPHWVKWWCNNSFDREVVLLAGLWNNELVKTQRWCKWCAILRNELFARECIKQYPPANLSHV